MVDRLIKDAHLAGMPWATVGDFNIGERGMSGILAEWQVVDAKVMSVGDTCFAKESRSAIDHGTVDHLMAPWLLHGRTAATNLATHMPAVWCMKWQIRGTHRSCAAV